jgi:hypothetical protein
MPVKTRLGALCALLHLLRYVVEQLSAEVLSYRREMRQ